MSTYRILVASYSSSIYTVEFSTSPPALRLVSSVEVGHHPSWITPHLSDPTTAFTGLEQADGKVAEVKYDEEGKGTVVGVLESGGADPCTLLAVGQELIIGNYSSGTVQSILLSSSSPYLPSKATHAPIQLQGTGPHPDRQLSSHPHQVYQPPSREEVLIPDLGADKTWRLVKRENGWSVAGAVAYQAGSGPRHVVVHEGTLYTVLELSNTLAVHSFPPLSASSQPTFITSHPTHIPAPAPSYASDTPKTPLSADAPPIMLAAEILLAPASPSFPTSHLYVSNRNDPSPGGDTIAIFALSPPSAPTRVGEVKTGLHHLRGMILFGPDERYLVAGGVNGGGVRVFERVDGGAGLREVARLPGLAEAQVGDAEGLVRAPTGFLVVHVNES